MRLQANFLLKNASVTGHGNLHSTCVRLLQMSASGAKEAGVQFTNGKRPAMRMGKGSLSAEIATADCPECKQQLVEIDNRGHHLRGCLTCNIWWSVSGGTQVKLSVEDLHALQQLWRTDRQ
jgi:hypothetical protein